MLEVHIAVDTVFTNGARKGLESSFLLIIFIHFSKEENAVSLSECKRKPGNTYVSCETEPLECLALFPPLTGYKEKGVN